MKYKKEKEVFRPEKSVVLNGYEYTLVECIRDANPPCALGYKNYAIKSVRKVKK